MSKARRWKLEIEHLMACNCNWGCPCSFESPPTYGKCESALAYRVIKGKFGEVPLDGLTWVLVASWPGPLYKRNGRGIVYLDENASDTQRKDLEAIATGRAGGPIGIFMSTITAGLDVRTAAIEFHASGKKSWFSVSGPSVQVQVTFGPIRNPVTGEEHMASALLPTGMLNKREDYYSADRFTVHAAPFDFEYPGRNAIYFHHTWRGP